MGLASLAAEVERKIFGLIRKLFGGGGEPHHLEVRAGVLDEVEARVQPVGEGQRRFPYNQLVVHVRAGDEERRDIFESAFVEGERLKTDILGRLRQTGAKLPPHLDVSVVFAGDDDEATASRGFRVEFRRAQRGPMPRARFTVLKGQAREMELQMSRPTLNVGRMEDVKDRRDLIVRRNDLVFVDADDELNKSVSRAHAHVFFDERESVFRICDDNSAQGTHIFRDGRTFEVPRNSTRGVRLRPADEIYFGRAVVRFDLIDEPPPAELPPPTTPAQLPAEPSAAPPAETQTDDTQPAPTPTPAPVETLNSSDVIPTPAPPLQETVRIPAPAPDAEDDDENN